jgi:hypothetical protein
MSCPPRLGMYQRCARAKRHLDRYKTTPTRRLSALRIFSDGSTIPLSVLETTPTFTSDFLANALWLPARLTSERSNRMTSLGLSRTSWVCGAPVWGSARRSPFPRCFAPRCSLLRHSHLGTLPVTSLGSPFGCMLLNYCAHSKKCDEAQNKPIEGRRREARRIAINIAKCQSF